MFAEGLGAGVAVGFIAVVTLGTTLVGAILCVLRVVALLATIEWLEVGVLTTSKLLVARAVVVTACPRTVQQNNPVTLKDS